MWRGGYRLNISVSASFVCCPAKAHTRAAILVDKFDAGGLKNLPTTSREPGVRIVGAFSLAGAKLLAIPQDAVTVGRRTGRRSPRPKLIVRHPFRGVTAEHLRRGFLKLRCV